MDWVVVRFLRGFVIGALLAITFLTLTGSVTIALELLGFDVR